jgi:hypothetical protein
LSGIYDENDVNTTNTPSLNSGLIGGINNNSFKRNTFLKNKNHTHKNNSNRKAETNVVTPLAIPIQDVEPIEPVEPSQSNIISSIVENIIENVKTSLERVVTYK